MNEQSNLTDITDVHRLICKSVLSVRNKKLKTLMPRKCATQLQFNGSNIAGVIIDLTI